MRRHPIGCVAPRPVEAFLFVLMWLLAMPVHVTAQESVPNLPALEDFVQTSTMKCDNLDGKADACFDRLRQSAQYKQIQASKANLRTGMEGVLAKRQTGGDLTPDLAAKAEALLKAYDRDLEAVMAAFNARYGPQVVQADEALRAEADKMQKSLLERRDALLEWRHLCDPGQADELARLEARQEELEKQKAQIEEMFRSDPKLAATNQALLTEATNLLNEARGKLAAARTRNDQFKKQAKDVTGKSDEAHAIESLQDRVDALRIQWNKARIKLLRMQSKLHEATDRSLNATVHVTHGAVTVSRGDGQAVAVAEGLVMLPGDTIRTMDDGVASVTLCDGSRVNLSHQAIFTLDAQDASKGWIKSGSVWFDGVIAGLRDRYQVRIPTAVAAVRGTDVLFTVDEKQTSVAVGDGEVEITFAAGGLPMQLHPGQRATWANGQDKVLTGAIRDYDDLLAEKMSDLPLAIRSPSLGTTGEGGVGGLRVADVPLPVVVERPIKESSAVPATISAPVIEVPPAVVDTPPDAVPGNVEVKASVSGTIKQAPAKGLLGAQVRQGQILARLDDAEFVTEAATADAALDKARQELKRGKDLARQNAISKDDLDNLKTAFNDATAAAQLAHQNLEACKIKAPVAGTLIQVNVDTGDSVAPGDEAPALFVIAGGPRPEGVAKATQDLDIFCLALDKYAADTGAYPTTKQGLKALLVCPAGVDNWDGPYINKALGLKDPWGHPYVYRSSGPKVDDVGDPYDLFSAGPDGIAGTGDDVSPTTPAGL